MDYINKALSFIKDYVNGKISESIEKNEIATVKGSATDERSNPTNITYAPISDSDVYLKYWNSISTILKIPNDRIICDQIKEIFIKDKNVYKDNDIKIDIIKIKSQGSMNNVEKNILPLEIPLNNEIAIPNEAEKAISKENNNDKEEMKKDDSQTKIEESNSSSAILIDSTLKSTIKLSNDVDKEVLTDNLTESLNNEENESIEEFELNIPQKIVSKCKFSTIKKSLNEEEKNYKKILKNAQKVLKEGPINSSKRKLNKNDQSSNNKIELKKQEDEKILAKANYEGNTAIKQKTKKKRSIKNRNQRPSSTSREFNDNERYKKDFQKGRIKNKINQEKANNNRKNKIEYVKKGKTNEDFIDKEKEKILNELLKTKEINKNQPNEEIFKLSSSTFSSQCLEINIESKAGNNLKQLNETNEIFSEIICDEDFFHELDKEINEETLKNDCYLINLIPYSEYIKKLIFNHLEEFKNSKKINYPYVHIVIYGSNSTQLSIENSDIDFAIEGFHGYFREDLIQLLFMLEEKFEGQSIVKSHNIISDANVPILKLKMDLDLMEKEIQSSEIKFKFPEKTINLDITFSDFYVDPYSFFPVKVAIQNSIYIKKVVQFYRNIRPISLIIKKLLYCKGLNVAFTGGLCSYAQLLLILAFLNKYEKEFEKIKKIQSVGITLFNLLKFYGFDFDFHSVSIAGESFYDMQYVNIQNSESNNKLYIMDPMNESNNVAHKAIRFEEIQFLFKNCYKKLENCKSLFKEKKVRILEDLYNQ